MYLSNVSLLYSTYQQTVFLIKDKNSGIRWWFSRVNLSDNFFIESNFSFFILISYRPYSQYKTLKSSLYQFVLWFLDPLQLLLKRVVDVPQNYLKMCHRPIKVEVMTSLPLHQKTHSSPISESGGAHPPCCSSQNLFDASFRTQTMSTSKVCPLRAHNVSWACPAVSTSRGQAAITCPVAAPQSGLCTLHSLPTSGHTELSRNLSLVQRQIDRGFCSAPNYSLLIIEQNKASSQEPASPSAISLHPTLLELAAL